MTRVVDNKNSHELPTYYYYPLPSPLTDPPPYSGATASILKQNLGNLFILGGSGRCLPCFTGYLGRPWGLLLLSFGVRYGRYDRRHDKSIQHERSTASGTSSSSTSSSSRGKQRAATARAQQPVAAETRVVQAAARAEQTAAAAAGVER